jgi:hypothetical protein
MSEKGDFSRPFGRDITSAKQSRHRHVPGTTTTKKPILSALANGMSTNTIVCNIYFNQITLAKENRAADSNSLSQFQLKRTFSSRTEESIDVHIPNNKTLVTTFNLGLPEIQNLRTLINMHNGDEDHPASEYSIPIETSSLLEQRKLRNSNIFWWTRKNTSHTAGIAWSTGTTLQIVTVMHSSTRLVNSTGSILKLLEMEIISYDWVADSMKAKSFQELPMYIMNQQDFDPQRPPQAGCR